MKLKSSFAFIGTAALVAVSGIYSASAAEQPFSIHMGSASSGNEAIIGGVEVSAGDPVATSTVLIVGKEGSEEFICSGSIISNDLILTAAHCLGDTGKAQLVVAFRTDVNGSGPVIAVKAQNRPSDFVSNEQNATTDWDDLGMLRLASPIPAGYAPAQFLQDPSAIQNGASIVLAGYGIDVPVPPTDPTDTGGAGVLRKVNQTIVNASYGQTEVLVSLKDKGACHGDSGGPAFIQSNGQLYLFGVTSRLTDDDQVSNNGSVQDYTCSVDMVYTNILARMNWIQSTAASLENQ